MRSAQFAQRYTHGQSHNFFMLPHRVTTKREMRDAIGYCALDNLVAYISGKEPRDRVV